MRHFYRWAPWITVGIVGLTFCACPTLHNALDFGVVFFLCLGYEAKAIGVTP